MDYYNQKIGKRIKELRLAKGLTAEQLAWGGGMSKSTITAAEKGAAGITIKTLLRVCASLKISLSEFFNTFNEIIEVDDEI